MEMEWNGTEWNGMEMDCIACDVAQRMTFNIAFVVFALRCVALRAAAAADHHLLGRGVASLVEASASSSRKTIAS